MQEGHADAFHRMYELAGENLLDRKSALGAAVAGH
jgi:hypothetical protein